jgi:hypothetical protein
MLRLTIQKLILVKLLFLNGILSAQFYNTGSASNSVKWQTIKTPAANIIFPWGMQKQANIFANCLLLNSDSTAFSQNRKSIKPINVVFYNANVQSNGYVVWAPRRMELITTPPQETFPQLWLPQLALHEYRHVHQLEALNSGTTKFFSWLLGNMAIGATSAFLPLWFMEGDAVLNETRLSSTGRGREASFYREIRALESDSRKRYSYDQAYLGTYKTYLPNYYNYGYPMVVWANCKYGKEFWPNVLHRVARYPIPPSAFYFGMKAEGGLSKVKLYDSTLNYLNIYWKSETKNQQKSNCTAVLKTEKQQYTNYKFPYQLTDSTILAFRSSLDEPTKLICISGNSEKEWFTVGSFHGSRPTYSKDYVAWEETHYDLRWEQKTYSVIRLFSVQSKRSFILKSRERHFAPAIDDSCKKISVIKIDEFNNYRIEVYDILSKLLLENIIVGDTIQLSDLTWMNDTQVVTIAVSNLGNYLCLVDLTSKSITPITEPSLKTISNISYCNNRLYFTGTYDGRLNIYSLGLNDKRIVRLTNSYIGTDFGKFSLGNQQLLFSEYSSKGYSIKSLNRKEFDTTSIENIAEYHFPFDELFPKRKIEMKIDTSKYIHYQPKAYHKLLHSFNFHSWLMPFYFDFQKLSETGEFEYPVFPGFNLLSQNILSTVTSSFGYYRYNGYNHFRTAISVRAFYPVFSFASEIGGPSYLIWRSDSDSLKPNKLKPYYSVSASIKLPLTVTNSRYTGKITPSIDYNYYNSYIATDENNPKDGYSFLIDSIYFYKGLSVTYFDLNFYLFSKMAYRNLLPRWGIQAYLSHTEANKSYPFARYYKSSLATTTFYLPGLWPNHSLKVKSAVEFGYGDRLVLPRGFENDVFYRDKNSYKLGAEYALPLFYPDFSVGPVLYLKRIQASVFFESMNFPNGILAENSTTEYKWLASGGLNLGFEINLLRFYWSILPTLSYSYRINDGKSQFGFSLTGSYSFSLSKQYRAEP